MLKPVNIQTNNKNHVNLIVVGEDSSGWVELIDKGMGRKCCC